jgi:tetratricopeptide (TPR) repeat protein
LIDLITYGYCYKELGDYHRAKSYLKDALSFDEYNDEIYYELSLLFYEEHKYEASLPLINKALDKNQESAHYLELKADILIALQRTEEACELYLSIIQLNSSTPYYLSKFAFITALQHGIDEAIKILDQGILDHNYPSLHYQKAIIYFLFDREEDGFNEFAIGLDQDFEAHTIVLEKLPELKDNKKIQLMISVYESK